MSRAAGASTGGTIRLRAGDRERSRTASDLAEHYARGRLDHEEFDRRTTVALTAVHLDELDDLLADLPTDHDGSRASIAPRRSRRHPSLPARGRLLLLVAAVLSLIIATRGAALWLLPVLWWMGAARVLAWGRPQRAWHGPPARWAEEPRRSHVASRSPGSPCMMLNLERR